MIEGARRVGKSYIVEEFVWKEYEHSLLISHAFSENQAALDDIVKAILFGKLEVNKGMIIENAVAQMFRAAGQELYFHFNDDRKNVANTMEVDFVLTKSKVSSAHNVYPIEAKSNKEYSTTSLERFRTKFRRYVATPIVLHPKDLGKGGVWFQEGLALGKTICYTFRQLKTFAAHLSIRRKTGKRPKSEKRYERKNRNQPECLSWQSGDQRHTSPCVPDSWCTFRR